MLNYLDFEKPIAELETRVAELRETASSSDIDIVYLNGYGFPPWRGGPMFYADQVGLSEVAHALQGIAAQPRADKAFWTPAPLLARLAQTGKTFSAYKGSDK